MRGGPRLRPPTDGPVGRALAGLDPAVAAAVDALPVGTPGLDEPGALREFVGGPSTARGAGDDRRVVRDELRVPAAPGAPGVAVRRYRPREAPSRRPGLVWCHGGGFVAGDLDAADARCARLCADLDAVVLSVGYRRAPEHPFPAALEDVRAVAGWVGARPGTAGVEPTRLLVGGSSAGAALAAGAALWARDHGGPALAGQVLVQPALDDRCDTPSSREVVDPRVLHREAQREMWDLYLGPEGTRGPVPPYAAPARAADLRGLPPAVVTTAEHDPLRDEGLAYAARLRAGGVPTALRHVPGTVHGFEELVPDAAVSRRTHGWLVASVTAVLARGGGGDGGRPGR